MKIEPFVFLDDESRPFKVQNWGEAEDVWLFYWHPDKKWVSLRKLTGVFQVDSMRARSLPSDQAAMYEPGWKPPVKQDPTTEALTALAELLDKLKIDIEIDSKCGCDTRFEIHGDRCDWAIIIPGRYVDAKSIRALIADREG